MPLSVKSEIERIEAIYKLFCGRSQLKLKFDGDRVGQIYIKKQKFALGMGLEQILDINYVKLTNIYEMYNI
jgi:hypothetical protein